MSSVSGFSSKDVFLRRLARVNRTHKNGTRSSPAKKRRASTGSFFDTVLEDEFDSSPGAPMPLSRLTTRARRRHALNVPPVGLETALSDVADQVITFTDFVVRFPLPPLPTPPTPSPSPCKSPPSMSSSLSSSPDSQTSFLPLTPSSSDDELSPPSPPCNPRRVTVKPLVIHKIHRPPTLPTIDTSEESDSDSEWYTREFSKMLSLNPAPPPTYFPAAHRDSIAIVPNCDSPRSPSHRRRRQGSGFKSFAFDVSRVPPVPPTLLSPRCRKTLSVTAPRRPPPRMSIPDDACSPFSLSYYLDDVTEAQPSPLSMYSQASARTGILPISEAEIEEVEFPEDFEVQVDCPMMLPLSIPGTPIDLEADIAHGLEDLWLRGNTFVESPQNLRPNEQDLGVGFVLEEADGGDQTEELTEVPLPRIVCTSPPPTLSIPAPPSGPPSIPLPPLPTSVRLAPPRRPVRPASMSTISSFSFFPSPPSQYQELPVEETRPDDEFDETKYGLKSRWSASTLASTHDEHAAASPKFSGASKLRTYFQGQHRRSTSAAPSPVSPNFTIPSMSPSFLMAKAKDKKGRNKQNSGSSDVLVIGFNKDFSI